MVSQKSYEEAKTPFYILLKAIFDVVREELVDFKPKGPLAKAWRDHLGLAGTKSVRDRLYNKAVENANKAVKIADAEKIAKESQVIIFTCDD
jgi:hypothetical protein